MEQDMSGSEDSGAAEIKLEARIVSDAKSGESTAQSLDDQVNKPMSEALDAPWGKWGPDAPGSNFVSSLPSKSDILGPLTYVSDQLKAVDKLLQKAHPPSIAGDGH